MSKILSNEEAAQINLFDKIYLSMQLTKLCSRSCGIMNITNNNYSLTAQQKDCMNICGQNINLTYGNFMNRMKKEIDYPEIEDEDNGDGDAGDDEE